MAHQALQLPRAQKCLADVEVNEAFCFHRGPFLLLSGSQMMPRHRIVPRCGFWLPAPGDIPCAAHENVLETK